MTLKKRLDAGYAATSALAFSQLIGRRAWERRLALNFSQEEAAARAGLTVSTLRRIEHGTNVGFGAIIALAFALRVESDVIGLFAPRATEPIRQRASRTAKTVQSGQN